MFVSSLSLAAFACLATQSVSTEISSHSASAKFRKIFGEEQFNAHFQSSEMFATSLRGKQEMLMKLKSSNVADTDTLTNYVLCTTHVGGEAMRQSLNSHFGEDNVHPLYQSSADNSFCFLVALPSSSAGISQTVASKIAAMSGSSIEFVLPQPDVMKIHHSLLDHLMLTQNKKGVAKANSDDSIATSTISVSLGLGNGRAKKIDGLGLGKGASKSNGHSAQHPTGATGHLHDQMRAALLARQPHEHIKKLMQSTRGTESSSSATLSTSATDQNDMWHSAFKELSSARETSTGPGIMGTSAKDSDPCGFSKLIFSHGYEQEGGAEKDTASFTAGGSFSIDGLGHITSASATPSSCFASLLAFLATSDEHIADVRYSLPFTVQNKYGKSVVQKMTSDQGTPYTNAGLTGAGQVVGVGDSGLDERSCFFANADNSLVARSSYRSPTYDNTKRKVIQYINYMNDFDTAGGHGTHVCGTIAGASTTTSMSDNGHASGAKIAFFDMSKDGNSINYPEPVDQNVFKPAFNAGARLHSNSWGSALNVYQQNVISVDSYHLEQDQFLALFAAGNEGDDGYYSMGSPGISKNAITVGASKSGSSTGLTFTGPMDSVAYFSSIGPTFDKRIKPDIVAPGSYIESADASGSTAFTCSTLTMQGTSMATPAVAGVGAQIRQYFSDSQFWAATCRNNAVYAKCAGGAFNPRGATVKAMLIHSGETMASYTGGTQEPYATLGNPPDYYQGFGRVFLQNVLPFAGIETVLDLYVEEVTMTSWQQLTFNVVVTDTTRPVKITVVWMDPVNSVISHKMLLHDIDVTLKLSGGSTTIFGNNIQNDELNNVEQAMIQAPVVGTYIATVTSKTFTENAGTQKASIVITSGGSVTSRTVQVVTAASTAYCPTGQQLITMNLLDRGADGWPSGTVYEIRTSANVLFKSGTLGTAASFDFNVPVTFCLPALDIYTVSLLLPSGNTADAKDVGLEIPGCKVYLSYYKTSATLDLNSNSAMCNPCGITESAVSVYLSDAPLLTHYGWNRDSTYTLSKVEDGNYAGGLETVVLKGTLLYGYIGWVDVCLAAGSYRLTLDGFASTDDDYLTGEALYSATLVGCSLLGDNDDVPLIFDDDTFFPYPVMFEANQMKITATSAGVCTVDVSASNDNSDPSSSSSLLPSSLLSLAAIATATLLCILG